MSFDLTIVQEPQINNGFGDNARWNTSQNPMIWKLQRKDYIIKSVMFLVPGTTRIFFWQNPVTITNNSTIWWGDSINLKDGEYLITNVNNFAFYIDIAAEFNGSALGWINDTANILNYHAYLQIYRWPTPGDIISRVKFYDDEKGLITADLHKFLEGELSIEIPSPFGIASQEENKDRDFSFTYGPGFLNDDHGGSPIFLADYDQRFWIYKSSAQLGDEFGQNLRRQMLYGAEDPLDSDALMKFNTVFEEPYFFDGYPFMLSFIYSDHFTTNYLHRHVQRLDINDLATGPEENDLVPSTIKEHGCVVTLRDFGALTDDVEGFYLWLQDSGVPLTVDPGDGGGSSGGGGSDPSAFEDEVFEFGIFEQ